MKNYCYLFAFLGMLNFSCSDDSDPIRACEVGNVLELPWVQERIAEIESTEFGREYSYISMGTYKSQTVFVLGNCCSFCNTVVPILDCDGNTLVTLGSGIDFNEIIDRKMVWKSSANLCNV